MKCTDNFYLMENKCEVRGNEIERCKEYVNDEDKCFECMEGYYVIEDGTQCVDYPIGSPGCRLYTDSKVCRGCITNKYLSNNLCVDIPDDSKVENCMYYVAPGICEECGVNYMNVDGKC